MSVEIDPTPLGWHSLTVLGSQANRHGAINVRVRRG
jgi:hypothetical protein